MIFGSFLQTLRSSLSEVQNELCFRMMVAVFSTYIWLYQMHERAGLKLEYAIVLNLAFFSIVVISTCRALAFPALGLPRHEIRQMLALWPLTVVLTLGVVITVVVLRLEFSSLVIKLVLAALMPAWFVVSRHHPTTEA